MNNHIMPEEWFVVLWFSVPVVMTTYLLTGNELAYKAALALMFFTFLLESINYFAISDGETDNTPAHE